MESEAKKIESAIKLCEECSSPLTPQWELILDLARSHLHAIQSGDVPKEQPEYTMIYHDNISHPMADMFGQGFNSCRSLMLTLIVARDRMLAEKDERIRELERRLK